MPLVITPGAAGADSYITLEQALARAGADLGRFAAKWKDAATPDEDREAALRRATLDVDDYIGYTELWDPYTPQARRFPRAEDLNLAGVTIIPEAIKKATYLQAIYVLSNAELIDDSATRRSRGLRNFSEPNVSGELSEPRAGLMAPRAVEVLDAFAEGTGGAVMAPIVKVY